jgi:hypothetical protein
MTIPLLDDAGVHSVRVTLGPVETPRFEARRTAAPQTSESSSDGA